LYSAWIETLFDAPDNEQPSWGALHEVLRDRRKNFFFDSLGAGEDSNNAPVVKPDCADLPFFLRAYFAFKMRLPLGIGQCERGGVLLAVDGQPDGTVARKRFWRGNFLYATQRELGGPGFKRFRPVVRRGGKLARSPDESIRANAEYGDLTRDAQKLDVEGFY